MIEFIARVIADFISLLLAFYLGVIKLGNCERLKKIIRGFLK